MQQNVALSELCQHLSSRQSSAEGHELEDPQVLCEFFQSSPLWPAADQPILALWELAVEESKRFQAEVVSLQMQETAHAEDAKWIALADREFTQLLNFLLRQGSVRKNWDFATAQRAEPSLRLTGGR